MFSNLVTIQDWTRFLLPFANEFANVFTQAGLTSMYLHHPQTTLQILSKAFIDFLALTGIVWNTAYASLNHIEFPLQMGVLKGVILLIFAFLIPNLYMEGMLKFFCNKLSKWICTKNGILIVGILIIIGLLVLETVSHHYSEKMLIEQLEKRTQTNK